MRAPRPKQCRAFVHRRIAEALPEIVDRFVKEAKLGSIAHVKALLSLSGFDRAETTQKGTSPRSSMSTRGRGSKRLSLADRLMEELKRGSGVEVRVPVEVLGEA